MFVDSKEQFKEYVKTAITASSSTTKVYFSPAIGNGSLYYYVGETV